MATNRQSAQIDICHLSSAHGRDDIRIGAKMARSAIQDGMSAAFVVADGKADETVDGLRIVGVRRYRWRLARIVFGPVAVFRAALRLDARIYKMHDPELLPLAMIARIFSRAKFVFDSHEDVPVQFLAKPYLTPALRRIGSAILKILLHFFCARLDGVIAATPLIHEKLSQANANAVTIRNYPLVSEFDGQHSRDIRRTSITYVGNIAESRGILELLEAVDLVREPVPLDLVGQFAERDTEERARRMTGWRMVTYHGWVGRGEVREALARSLAGIVTLRPHPNYIDALPVKMFEYMGAGVPVIASDFPLWRQIVETADCGLFVDPLDPQAIADAVQFMLDHPERAREMGVNGQRAVFERFNWKVEEAELLSFYRALHERCR